MSAIMQSVQTVVTAAIGYMGQFADAVTSNTVLTLGVIAIPMCGLGVGLLSRLLRKRV